jgi:hypothetical protein
MEPRQEESERYTHTQSLCLSLYVFVSDCLDCISLLVAAWSLERDNELHTPPGLVSHCSHLPVLTFLLQGIFSVCRSLPHFFERTLPAVYPHLMLSLSFWFLFTLVLSCTLSLSLTLVLSFSLSLSLSLSPSLSLSLVFSLSTLSPY